MELYVLVSFWLLIISGVIDTGIIATAEYPRKTQNSLGLDLVTYIIRIPFIVWCMYLLWL